MQDVRRPLLSSPDELARSSHTSPLEPSYTAAWKGKRADGSGYTTPEDQTRKAARSRFGSLRSMQSIHDALRDERAGPWLTCFSLGLIVAVGVTGGALVRDPDLTEPWAAVSSSVGWLYFACWSLSFWPQIYHNYKRQAVWGFSFDFGIYNLVGFGAYAIFNSALYWSARVRAAYVERHGTSSPVQLNDVFFSLHALLATLLTLFQCIIYDRRGQRVSETCKLAVCLAVLAALGYAVLVAIGKTICTCFTLLSWLYLLSYIKLIVTLFKYIPQIMLNYRAKSTAGWSISNCLLDLAGGILSLGQLFGDALNKHDSTAITGAPVKFGLGFVSIVADLIIMAQHYILYPEASQSATYEPLPL